MELKLDTDVMLSELEVVSQPKTDIEFAVGNHDRWIISANAIFEGIGIAGLIAAAFWYTTAPIAPDGFKGPISTYTIATTTVISLFLAIPIARYAYNKLIIDANRICSDLNSIIIDYLYSHDELIYDLLKLRSLCVSDNEFMAHLSSSDHTNSTFRDTTIQFACFQYHRLKNIHFYIKWEKPIQLSSLEYSGCSDKLSFHEILKNRDLSHNKPIKKMLLELIHTQPSDKDEQFQQIIHKSLVEGQKGGRLKNTIFGIASGIACAEVLLSIGWTVISVLIGIKAIVPISNVTWAIFAIFCIASGVVFGLGMGLSRHKQKKLQCLYEQIKQENDSLLQRSDYLNHSISEHSFYLNWNTYRESPTI